MRELSFGSDPETTRSGTPDPAKVDALVRAHLPLVGYVAGELSGRLPSHVNRDDLVSAGMAGLAEAAAAFDPSGGVPFHRYAAIRIKGAMLDELRTYDWVSRGARSRSRELAGAEETLSQELGRAPFNTEVATAMGLTLAELDRRRSETARAVVSLESMEGAAGQLVPDTGPDPGQRIVDAERVGYLRAAVAALPERSRVVITGLFLEQRSITEIAEELGVTESRISQLKTEALGLLHDALQVTHGDGETTGLPGQGTGVAARRREQFYANVAANAAAAGLGAQAALARAQTRAAAAGFTRSEHAEPLRTSGSMPMSSTAGHGRTA